MAFSSLDFPALVAKYGDATTIPNDDLYRYLVDNKENLINEQRLGLDRIPNSVLGREVRRRCKRDLMWLARYFTWETNPASDNGARPFEDNVFTEEFYGIFTKLFVQKDDTKPLNQQSDVKTRLLLWPRGGAKSTFDHVDTVQWILNFPHIRIQYLTATNDLATGFVGEIKGHFYFKEVPTLMNLFFPEFCVEEGKAGAGDVFTCPVYAKKKTGRKEPTVIASSVGKAKAGWRFELIKADDAVSDTNSENSIICEKISKHLFLAEKTLALGGHYVDYIGTRYHDDDHYGVLLEQNVGDITTTTGNGWEFMENKTTGVNILIGRAIQMRPGIAEQLEREGRSITYKEAGEENCILLLPHLMSFSWCMGDLAKDEVSFEGQRNQNPRPASNITFSRPLLQRATIPFNEMPQRGPVSQVWDFAFSTKKGRDYSTCASIMWTEEDEKDESGRPTGNKITVGYVQEVVRERFNQLDLARKIVEMVKKYKPFTVGVEDAAGSKWITDTVMNEAYRTADPSVIAVCSTIDFFPPDNQKDAKLVRMGSLYPRMVKGQLKFVNHCMSHNKAPNDKIEVLYDEFERCLTSHHHDDIPDVIALQTRYMPRATQAIALNDEDLMSSADPLWNLIFEEGTDCFGRVGYAPMMAPMIEEDFIEDPEFQSEAPDGLNNILGAGIFG